MRASTPRSPQASYTSTCIRIIRKVSESGGRRERRKNKTYTYICICSPNSCFRRVDIYLAVFERSRALSQEFPHFLCNFHHKFIINSINNNEQNVYLYSTLRPSNWRKEETQRDGNICRTVL